MGKRYVIEHCVCEHEKRIENLQYQAYITDVVKGIAESFGSSIQKRFIDIVLDKPKQNEKTADEIVLEVMKKAGLKVKT